MLYIPRPSISDLDEYFNSIKTGISDALAASKIGLQAKNFLSEDKIKEIITDTPDNLLHHHEELMPILIGGFNDAEYANYFVIKRQKKRSVVGKAIFKKYDDILKELIKIFDYKKYISSSQKTSYNLAAKLNRNTCTYCNRLYTNTIIVKDKKTNKINNTGRITRPQFDHWYAKSKYPLFALSFYNLIPSCSVCNSSIKGDALFSLNTHTHPYSKDNANGNDFTFSFYFTNANENNVRIKVPVNSKIDKTLKEFKIEEIYNAHSSLELKDLLDLKYKYSQNYLNTLFNETFKTLGVSKSEAYRLIFGAEYEEEEFHKRPFSKFKKDILKELNVIDW